MLSPTIFALRARRLIGLCGVTTLVLAACQPDGAAVLPSEPGLEAASRGGSTDPTATWKIPLADAGLALRSDGRFGDGTNSLYANGVCGVSAKIFATTAASNSGDATIQTSAPKAGKCGRVFTLVYPDAFTESVPSFNNLNVLQNTTYAIPIGSTVRRRLILAPGAISNNPSRCGRLLFGPNGTVSPGTDSLLVTRVDASTWLVASQPAPDNRALCENNGAIYAMPVRFTIVSSTPLP